MVGILLLIGSICEELTNLKQNYSNGDLVYTIKTKKL